MSNIIKAEYVLYDSKQKIPVKDQAINRVISSPKKDLFEIYNQRESVLKKAEAEAIKIINNAKIKAKNEIIQCKKTAYDEGYKAGVEIGKSEGYEDGYKAGHTEVSSLLEQNNESLIQELSVMIKKIEEEKQQIISNYEKELTNLSIEIAEKIIRNELKTQETVTIGIIRNAIKEYRNVEWIKVYISSKDDVIAIQADKDLINDLKKISKDVKIEVLGSLDKGSAVIETEDGIIEASIDTQLKNLKEMVLSKNAG